MIEAHEAIWLLSLRGGILGVLWEVLLLSCTGTVLAVILGVFFRRSVLWWLASILSVAGIVLFITIAALDKLGFK
jgi:hypothetical protein